MSGVAQPLSLVHAPAARLLTLARTYGTTLAVAGVVFVVAYDNGGYGESTRDTLAIVLWWVLMLAVVLGSWPLVRAPLAAVAAAGLLAAFAAFNLLSVAWAADAAGAYAEFTRVALYLAVFVVTVAASRRENAARWCDGLALGIAAVAIVALISRFFPHAFAQPRQIAQLLTSAQTRLSFPLGYWNGLGILTGMGIPLLLRAAVAGSSPITRGLALVPLPAMVDVLYLTSSRAGIATAAIALVAFLLLTSLRWAALAATTVAAAGSTAAILVLANRDTLVNGPLDSSLAHSQGRSAALIVGVVCLLTGLIYAAGCRAAAPEHWRSPLLGWGVFAAAVALAAAGIAKAHPVQRFEAFKQPPQQLNSAKLIQQHLVSKSGNGRWQLWSSAIDEFESEPLAGKGAGSFQAWWLRKGSLPTFVEDAHSLYAESLGELGIVGFVLVVLTFVSGVGVAARRLVRSDAAERVTLAALVSAFVAYAVAASVDWMWELTVVSVVAFVCLGLAAGPATALVARPRAARPLWRRRPRLLRYGFGASFFVGGLLLICAIGVPLLAGAKIKDSQSAAARGDLRSALDDALSARSIQPWSSSPYLQAALVEEQAGDLRAARSWIARAIRRDPQDWQLWYVASRIDTKQGAVRRAAREVVRARVLNRHSPLLRRS